MSCDASTGATYRGDDWVWNTTVDPGTATLTGVPLVQLIDSSNVVWATSDEGAVKLSGGPGDLPDTDLAGGVLAFWIAAADTADAPGYLIPTVQWLVDGALLTWSFPAIRPTAGVIA